MEVEPIPILLYHSVSESPSVGIARWNVRPETFLSHLDAIVELGCTTLTVSQYADAVEHSRPLPERLALVTFDDGFAEVASFAAPALAERGLSSTLYVTTGALMPESSVPVLLPPAPMIARGELADLEELGVEIGAHSHTHLQLDVLEESHIRDELSGSKAILEELLGHRVDSLAYPHGYSDRRVKRIAAEVGYRSACGVRNALSSRQDDPLSISRLTVLETTSEATIRAWLNRTGAPIGGADRYRTHLWRRYRRAKYRSARPVQPARAESV